MNHRSEDRQPPSTKPGEPGAGCLIKRFISHQSDKVQASWRGSKALAGELLPLLRARGVPLHHVLRQPDTSRAGDGVYGPLGCSWLVS